MIDAATICAAYNAARESREKELPDVNLDDKCLAGPDMSRMRFRLSHAAGLRAIAALHAKDTNREAFCYLTALALHYSQPYEVQ
jgi:hypothetical protein